MGEGAACVKTELMEVDAQVWDRGCSDSISLKDKTSMTSHWNPILKVPSLPSSTRV